jgi:hypothetical protein
MHSVRGLSLLVVLAALPLAGCGSSRVSEFPKAPAPVDNDKPLADLGAMFDGAPTNDSLPVEPAFDALPAKYDVVSLQSPVRNQSHRGDCTIFSTVALMEHLYIKEGTIKNPDFSEQYLNWSVKKQLGAYPTSEGSNNDSNVRAINQFGIVTEAADPYDNYPWNASNDPQCAPPADGAESGLPMKCYTNGDPSAGALAATKYFLPAGTYLSTASIKSHIKTHDEAVVIGITFFYQAWNHRLSELPINSDYWRMGFVTYPNADDKTKSFAKPAGHGILIVGWDDTLEVPMRDGTGKILTDAAGNVQKEKGFYIFKNSWGTGNFGINNPNGDGYGYISQKYVDEFGSAYVSSIPTNVPVPGGTPVTQHAASVAPVSIPDNDPAGVSSSVNVPNGGAITALTIGVDVTHTYVGDLRVQVTHLGKTATLQDQAGGSAHDLKKTFTASDFAGMDAAGAWTLSISDMAAQDVGTLNAWTLDVSTGS